MRTNRELVRHRRSVYVVLLLLLLLPPKESPGILAGRSPTGPINHPNSYKKKKFKFNANTCKCEFILVHRAQAGGEREEKDNKDNKKKKKTRYKLRVAREIT